MSNPFYSLMKHADSLMNMELIQIAYLLKASYTFLATFGQWKSRTYIYSV